MKNTRNLVITNKESYLKPDEAVKIGHHIYKTYGIPTTIEIAGKNKLDLKIDLIQLDDINYKSLKTDLETINIYIYKTTPKHHPILPDYAMLYYTKQHQNITTRCFVSQHPTLTTSH